MNIWGRDNIGLPWRRDETPGNAIDMIRNGIDLPSYEMSHDAMNHTVDMINKLSLSEVLTLRYIHIGFGCWSAALAAMVIGRVWYDSWRAQQLKGGHHPRYVLEKYTIGSALISYM
jgi:hypothetical protein